MRILAIETATDRCGVAVLMGADAQVDLLLTRPRSHAEFLVPMIEQALAMARMKAGELDLIAVSMGPGSYTGLRIGVSAAKGLAFATGARLVGVPSLHALAVSVAVHAVPGDHVLTAFAARRDELYVAVYAVGGGERRAEGGGVVVGPAAVSLSQLGEWVPPITGTLWVAGDGAEAALQALRPLHDERPTTHYQHAPALPAATPVGVLGREIFAAHGAADLATFEPFYLKEFVAKKPKRTIFDRLPF